MLMFVLQATPVFSAYVVPVHRIFDSPTFRISHQEITCVNQIIHDAFIVVNKGDTRRMANIFLRKASIGSVLVQHGFQPSAL